MADYKTVELWADSASFPGELEFVGAIVVPESFPFPDPGKIQIRFGATDLEPEEIP